MTFERVVAFIPFFIVALVFIPKIAAWIANRRNTKKLARMAKYLGFCLKISRGGLLYLVSDAKFGYAFQARFRGAFDSKAKNLIEGLKSDPEIHYMVLVDDDGIHNHYESKSIANPFFEKSDEQISLMLDLCTA